MANRRVILLLLFGIAVCALLLWGIQRHLSFFPVESKPKTILLDQPLSDIDRVTVERGDSRIGLRMRDGRWEMEAPFPAKVDQGAVARLLDVFESARVQDSLSFPEMRKRELSLKDFGFVPARAHVVLEGPRQRAELLFGALSPVGREVYVRMNQSDEILVMGASLYTAIPRTADDIRSRKLVYCDRGLVRTLEVRAPGRPFIKLSKETGTWWLVQPEQEPAADGKVETLLDTLYRARVTRFVWPTVSNVMDIAETESAFKTRLGVYGLGADSGIQIQVQETGAALPAKIVFGHALETTGGDAYALLQGGDAIGAVSNQVFQSFLLSPSALRDTRLFFESPDNVRRLQIYFGDALFVLTQTNSVWRLEAPVADVADQAAVRDTVERLLHLNAESVEDTGTSPLRRNDDEQALPISQVEVFGDKSSWRFTVSPDDMEGAFLRVAFTNSPTVFRVAGSNMPPALISMIGLLGLRDKTILTLPADSLRRITLKHGDGLHETVERSKTDPVWRLGDGMTGQVIGVRLDALIALLSQLKADRVASLTVDSKASDTYGLRKPWLELTVDVESDDAMRKTLLIGKDAGFGKRYAMLRGLDVLFVLKPEDLETLSERLVQPL